MDMLQLLDRTTIGIMLSAFAAALFCILPASRDIFPFWLMAAGLHIADTLFHELGHTVAAWLFGCPSIPMIFTLFGADQAGGMTLTWDRSWLMQLVAFAGLGYACYRARKNESWLLIPTAILNLFVVIIAFTKWYSLIIYYMGHGGSILIGGFFLFRSWIYLDARNAYERWLNALFGFFVIVSNFYFSYNLAFNSTAAGDYSDHVAFGITHNDFKEMAMAMSGWSVKGIAVFTMFYCMAAVIGSFLAAIRLGDKFDTVPY